jgi:molecular chaperone DnaK (HSP70)
MEQKYLTIDIGKGTTDLTLMAVTHKDASSAEKAEQRACSLTRQRRS